MKKIIQNLLVLFIFLNPINAQAKLYIEGSSKFIRKVNSNLYEAGKSSKYLMKIIEELKKSKQKIKIIPITNDKSTWHRSGKKSRSHTEAIDDKKYGAERSIPTDSIIYINKNRISKNNKTYKSGTLIHELIHALDLANGNYNGDYIVREKRAVFFQNIWRDKQSKKLRSSYHGRFETKEYQNMKAKNKIDKFVTYYFTHSDIP
ncbi:MAG TPA: hypothetical protein ENJ28_05715 [Gammaproteobacteria bacterium]|nr:hypothetical protein [Gammaproteobacteria bacterium]